VVAAAIALTAAAAVATALAIQDRKDDAITAEITREESHLRELGAQIASIKDADLTSRNDFIAAYAQVEPLERLHGRYHPESWEKMSQIIDLVRKINEATKREISVVHAMAGLPEPERARFWHEQFMPLAAQEHALRERLQIVGQEQAPDCSVQ
jgi:hypothetical protein